MKDLTKWTQLVREKDVTPSLERDKIEARRSFDERLEIERKKICNQVVNYIATRHISPDYKESDLHIIQRVGSHESIRDEHGNMKREAKHREDFYIYGCHAGYVEMHFGHDDDSDFKFFIHTRSDVFDIKGPKPEMDTAIDVKTAGPFSYCQRTPWTRHLL